MPAGGKFETGQAGWFIDSLRPEGDSPSGLSDWFGSGGSYLL